MEDYAVLIFVISASSARLGDTDQIISDRVNDDIFWEQSIRTARTAATG